jgi:hypothetical protein
MIRMDRDLILNNFYTNLDTIAKIENGHKLYIDKQQMIQLDEPYMFQGIWRYCYSISRKDAIHILTKLFNDIEIYINAIYLKNIDYKNSNYPKVSRSSEIEYNTFITVIEKITKALQGIGYLQATYIDDKVTCADLQRVIDKGKSLVDNFSMMI